MSRMNEGDSGKSAQQLKDKAGEVAQNLRDVGGQVTDAAREQYEQIRNTATDYYQQGRERAMEAEQNLENYVREQPVKALLIAAGVGMLVGILWRRH